MFYSLSSDIILPLWNGRFFHKLTHCFSTKNSRTTEELLHCILSMLYRGMFVIQSCCLKSDMDVLTAYFDLYLSQKAFRLLAFKFSHIFGLSHIFGSVPQILPFLVFLWYVFNLCKLVMSHILALSLLLSHIDLFSYCYVN